MTVCRIVAGWSPAQLTLLQELCPGLWDWTPGSPAAAGGGEVTLHAARKHGADRGSGQARDLLLLLLLHFVGEL